MTKVLKLYTVLWTILPLTLSLSNNNSLCSSEALDDQCAAHLYQIIKPMMYYFGQANEQIRVKDEKIAELEKEIGRVHRNERTLEIETFEKKTSLLESQIYNLTKLIENGVYEVADIKETIKKDSLRQKALENTLEMSNKVITNLGNKIANMEENITRESKQQIYKLVGQVASLNGQIDKFVGEVSSLNIQLFSLRPLLDTVVHLKNDISKSNQVFEELKDIVQTDSDIQRKVKIEVEALSSQMSKLEARFDESADLLKDHPNGCADVKNYSGVLKIKPNALTPFLVSCESKVAGSGWTVIQRRIDGSVNFYRNWADYKQGFGNIDGEYFIGLERLHKLTKQQRHELYIKLVDQSNEVRYARYDNFVVEDEDQKYQLSAVGSYTGNAGDSFKGHRGLKFSTFDRDHDTYGGNCALDVKSAWWFFNCGDSNLNARNFTCTLENSNSLENYGCIYWNTWHGRSYSLKNVQMMIRPWNQH